MQRRIFQCFFPADGAFYFVFPQHIHFFTHSKSGSTPSRFSSFSFSTKDDHPLKIIFDLRFFCFIKLQPGKMGQFVHHCIVHFHQAKIVVSHLVGSPET